MNYISFSIWGNDPLYNIGIISNLKLIRTIYKDWKTVIFFDDTVPISTIRKISQYNTIQFNMSNSNLYGMFWRFLAADLPDAEYVCFRDADSRVSFREKLAVNEWISSGKSIHVMRDHPLHGIPFGADKMSILGGMWGCFAPNLQMMNLISDFKDASKKVYGQDQKFLQIIYDKFADDKITHDEFFEIYPFPIPRENKRFIGERIGVNEKPYNNDFLLI